MSDIIIANDQDEAIGHKARDTLTQTDIYRVASLWLTNSQGDILLAQRKFTKKHDPGKWGPAVSGTVEADETYDSNIIKEIYEEIGVSSIELLKGPKYRITGEHNYFCQWFTAILDQPADSFTIEEDAVEQVRWFTPAELREAIRQHPEQFLPGLGRLIDALR